MARSSNRKKRFTGNSIVVVIILGLFYFAARTLPACNHNLPSSHVDGFDGIALQQVETNPTLDEVMIEYPGMIISFNPKLHIPNWVAWELTADETDGEEPRNDKFYCDENVAGCPDTWDYSYSGYDRGHMAPAADMKWSAEAMNSSFYLTNVCPQAPELNRGSWKRLEEKCRVRAKTDSAVIIVCGPVLTDEITEFIGDSRVAVPKRFFKVVLSPYRENPVAIGFIMPNGAVPGGMQPHATTVDEVERVTGHDFFRSLPDDVENEIESVFNFNNWSRQL